MGPQNYVIQPGDTLSGIAKKFGVADYNLIAKANNISNPNLIIAGRSLSIPAANPGSVPAPQTQAPAQQQPQPAQPQAGGGSFESWLRSHGYNDQNVINQAVANPASVGSAYQDYLRESGGGSSAGPTTAPTFDLVGATNAAYNTPEILAANEAIKAANAKLIARQQARADALAGENDNPFYSAATLTGKIAKIDQKYNDDVQVIQNEVTQAAQQLATLKADAAIKVNAAAGQYNINRQAYKDTLDQFDMILKAGGLTNASAEDLANYAVQTGIPVSTLLSIQQKQKSDGIKTQLITADDGTVSVINTANGSVISQTQPGVGGTSKPAGSGSGGGTAKTPDTNKYLTKATSYLKEADIAFTGKNTGDKLLSRSEQEQAFAQILALVGGDEDLAQRVFTQAFNAGGFGNYGS